jgi:ZIP family zinc transporter
MTVPAPLQAATWGLLGAASLSVGAEAAYLLHLGRRVVGAIIAFGVGALVASVAFELVEPAMASGQSWRAGVGLTLGTLSFYGGDRLVGHLSRGGDRKPAGADTDGGGSGLAIVIGAALDGIPESAVLGMSLVEGGVSLALLSGIWLSNFPEALASTVDLRRGGVARRTVRVIWASIVVVSAAAALGGYLLIQASSARTGAFAEAFAAGALLTMLIDEMVPEAHEALGPVAGPVTVCGFAFALWLSALG